ncbi:MAG: NAD(P)-dependent dehydrogenase (short-subunit alcohol dehydrogenase family) [Planctomycetota bacterium]|jgi:NAD(P)-dependent dehydrogenase (short-subunit alcohol dehydrogenase family)
MVGVEGKVALVTGAGRGIGRELATMLAARGARVMGVARNEEQLSTLPCDWFAADLGTPAGCKLAVDTAQERLGPIDILICNHGIGSANERVIWEQDEQAWDLSLRVNLDAAFHLSKRVLPAMVKRRSGRLVFTCSTAAEIAEAASPAYNSSKHGLLGLMRSIALDAGPYDITSNAVLPGWVRTEMAEGSARTEAEERGVTVDEVWQERAALYPPGRVPTVTEVAQVIAFLASDEASGVSGQAITVALGGLT